MNKQWKIINTKYDKTRRGGMEPIYSLGNGYMAIRGFFEEEFEGIKALGGIYMPGVLGKARYEAWEGCGRELVNTSNIFWLKIKINDEIVIMDENNPNGFFIELDMEKGLLKRHYIWNSSDDAVKVELTFMRFVSMDYKHISGQELEVKVVKGNAKIDVIMDINTEILNLNMENCEPWPIQPGAKHIHLVERTKWFDESIYEWMDVKTKVVEPELISINYRQKSECLLNGRGVNNATHNIKTGDTVVYRKLIATIVGKGNETSILEYKVYEHSKRSNDDYIETIFLNGKKALDYITLENMNFDEALENHIFAWRKKWEIIDFKIAGVNPKVELDQQAIRYNMFQLIQSSPDYTNEYSIGARGLTGEMYEGCVFWDTEAFMLPFFTNTNPSNARKLLEHRYKTLPQARKHAKANWFDGAMFGWQVNEKGEEQTPKGVGAYYSIHVISDIAMGILDYWNSTRDEEFMISMGCEMLVETSRFWNSRAVYDARDEHYNILAVRGPNEYDVIVNNNVYTNMMAIENIRLTIEIISLMKKNYIEEWKFLEKKLCISSDEIKQWENVADKIRICYNESLDLFEEDDMYLYRKPLDMKHAKPTAKRIIDTTIPYEGLMYYQVSKQADVLHLMKNLPWKFTKKQIENAWNFYVPKTCHDSSLSYSMHSLVGARIGKMEDSYRFFDISSNLDLRDIQLNTISGLHFANFGGTWQAAYLGFAGLTVEKDVLKIEPNLPEHWDGVECHIQYLGQVLKVIITKEVIRVEYVSKTPESVDIPLLIDGKKIVLTDINIEIKR